MLKCQIYKSSSIFGTISRFSRSLLKNTPAPGLSYKIPHKLKGSQKVAIAVPFYYHDFYFFELSSAMKSELKLLLREALITLQQTKIIDENLIFPNVLVERTRDESRGDYATSLALQLAKLANKKPREVAELLVTNLPPSDLIEKVEIAGPGFINFFMTQKAFHRVIEAVLTKQSRFGHAAQKEKKSIHIEIISANPNGPLHVGHGRLAAFGDSLANLLEVSGHTVHREYYLNDAGRQMDILATSVWIRYLEISGINVPFPSNGYHGEYVVDIAAQLKETYRDQFIQERSVIFHDLPADEGEGGDKDTYIDALIARTKSLLGDKDYQIIYQKALNFEVEDISQDLQEFGVTIDEWFSERALTLSHAVQETIELLKKRNHVYERDGAIWFNAIHFGDEKDRVLIRSNGQITYFASDIAYHLNKLNRGYQQLIDVFGADHHGYVHRIKAAMKAFGKEASVCDVILVQFVTLYRGKERLAMSTRKGSFVTLRELREEVGVDAARFFYIQRRADQHMDFDLELAKQQSSDNPVYYIQYAHARICSVLRQAADKQVQWDTKESLTNLDLLNTSYEKQLLRLLTSYPEVIENAAEAREPHQLPIFLRELANALHTYYNAHQFLVEQSDLRDARLCLIMAVRLVLANGLKIIGVSAPEKM